MSCNIPALFLLQITIIIAASCTNLNLLPVVCANPVVNRSTKTWGIIASNVRGGGEGEEGAEDDQRKRFEELLRKAQIDPSLVFTDDDAGSILSPLQRLMSDENVDLFAICQLQYWYESEMKPDEEGRAQYLTYKENFVSEMNDHLVNADIEQGTEEEYGEVKDDKKVLITNLIRLLSSDYLHS